MWWALKRATFCACLHLGAQKDFEDAVHLFALFEESLSKTELQRWVERLGVEDDYEQLTAA